MRMKDFNWVTGLFLILYHVLLLIFLPLYVWTVGWPRTSLLIAMVVLIVPIGLGVTAGYHRLYAHKAYKTNKVMEFLLLSFGGLAQGSVLRWAYNHRLHHRFTDTDKDPHSIKKGFWYAHMWWLFEKEKPMDKNVVPDLLENKLVMFQRKHYVAIFTLLNALTVVITGFLLKDFFGAFVFCFLLRMFIVHHFTFFINSLAHYSGSRMYSRELSAVDNYILSLLTFGEGYHNYHHTFPSDYRNGVRWYHFDPTKWLVWSLSKIKVTRSLISMRPMTIKRRLIYEDKRIMLDKLKNIVSAQRKVFHKKVHELYERLNTRMLVLHRMKSEYRSHKKTKTNKEKLNMILTAVKHHKKNLRADWNNWCALVETIMAQKRVAT